MTNIIKCSKCGNAIKIDEAIRKELEREILIETETKHRKEIERIKSEVLTSSKKEAAYKTKLELDKKDKELSSLKVEKAKLESEKDRLAHERKKIEENATKKAEEKLKSELGNMEKERQELKESLSQKNQKLEEAREAELKIRKEKNQLEEDKNAFELEKQRQLDEERTKIREDALKSLTEEHRLKDAEMNKKLRDALETNDTLKRKLEQGSQQMQGEVSELDLEETLKSEFPLDEILPVPKGIRGADLIQKIMTKSGHIAGIIAWESKRTQAWSDGWIEKLKGDQRFIKGDVAILISENLPVGTKNFGFKDGIYVANPQSAINLGRIIRANVLSIARIGSFQEGRNEKKDVMYDYLCGPEFRGRVEAIIEATITAKSELDREKRAYTKIWAAREKHIERVESNMIGIYGDMQGIAGPSLPDIKSLMLTSGKEDLQTIITEKDNARMKKKDNSQSQLELEGYIK